jgi:hypothetical protein
MEVFRRGPMADSSSATSHRIELRDINESLHRLLPPAPASLRTEVKL